MTIALLSVMKAHKCIAKGYPIFLAHVVDSSSKKSSLSKVEVVKEYVDVFPDDLPSLPLSR